MEIRDQFVFISEFFNKEKIQFAVVGAFALHAYGYTRATKDIDFFVKQEDLSKEVLGEDKDA